MPVDGARAAHARLGVRRALCTTNVPEAGRGSCRNKLIGHPCPVSGKWLSGQNQTVFFFYLLWAIMITMPLHTCVWQALRTLFAWRVCNLFFAINPDPAHLVLCVWRASFRLHLTGIAFVCDPRRLAVKPSPFGWPSMSKMDQAGSPEKNSLNFPSQVSALNVVCQKAVWCRSVPSVARLILVPIEACQILSKSLGTLVRIGKASTNSLSCLTAGLVTTQWNCSQELKDTLGCSS